MVLRLPSLSSARRRFYIQVVLRVNWDFISNPLKKLKKVHVGPQTFVKAALLIADSVLDFNKNGLSIWKTVKAEYIKDYIKPCCQPGNV